MDSHKKFVFNNMQAATDNYFLTIVKIFYKKKLPEL